MKDLIKQRREIDKRLCEELGLRSDSALVDLSAHEWRLCKWYVYIDHDPFERFSQLEIRVGGLVALALDLGEEWEVICLFDETLQIFEDE